MQLRGIEQVESVLLPYGKAQVGDLQPFFLAGNGNDITVLHRLPHQLGILDSKFGDIAERLACERLFLLANFFHQRRVRLQCLITSWMLTHEVDVDVLKSREGRIGPLNLLNESHLLLIQNPVGEIVQSTGIAVQHTLTIAQNAQCLQIVGPLALLLLDTQRQCRYRLDKGSAIQLSGVDHQLFAVVHLQRVCYIRHTLELACEP